MNKKHSAEAYRLRAEELRAIASEMKQVETRRILLSIAEDYDGLSKSAQFLTECRERLTAVSEELDRPPAAPAGNGDGQGNGAGDNGVRACRTMAADAERLGAQSEGESREAWIQLAERWTKLANSLEQSERDGGGGVGHG